MNSIVKIEPPFIKKEIIQCKRCQRYGHTQKYCNHNYRCVKCAGLHATSQCTKTAETPAKCILCQGEHPANYKGCTVYKILYKNKYPKPRVRNLTNQALNSQKFTNPSISYAQVIQGNQSRPKNYSDEPQTSVPNSQNMDNINRLEKLFREQTEQIGNLLSLLTMIVDKLARIDVK